MKLSHTKLIAISGLVWFAVGLYLLQLGLGLLLGPVNASGSEQHYPMISGLIQLVGSAQNAVLLLILVALFVGYMKGRYVLGKSAQRGVERILSFPNPASLAKIYSPRYYLLLLGMIALGVSIKYFGLSNDVRGLIDTTIGAALINGAMIYFRLAQQSRSKSSA